MNLLPSFLRRRTRPQTEVVVGEEKSYWFDFFKTDPGWWQKGTDVSAARGNDVASNTAVYTCTNILSQEVASLEIDHWRVDQSTGKRTRVFNSAASRVLRRPNPYQTRSDFWLYLMRSMLLRGGGFAASSKNNRNEIIRLDPLPPMSCTPMVSPVNGEVFYNVGNFGDNLFKVGNTLPAERIFNPRINCNRHPLIGESPIAAFINAAAAGSAVQSQIARFFSNMSRPSGVLTTPKILTTKQMDELRDRWRAATSGDESGGTPVLHSELKWDKITMSATDSDLIASYHLTVADIAMAYRIPLFMLGDLSKSTFKNVESLMRVFYTSSLRFYLEHLENALNWLFGLDGETEYLEFDIESGLLRGDLETRMRSLSLGVQGGVLSPNEARKSEELGPMEGGDQIFMQKQMVPVSLINDLATAEVANAKAPPPNPAPPAPPPAKALEEDDDYEDAEVIANELMRRLSYTPPPPALSFSHSNDFPLEVVQHMKAPVVNVAAAEVPAPVVNINLDVIALADALRVALSNMPATIVNVPRQETPVVNMQAPIVNLPAPIVNLPASIVNVEAPIVNVAPAVVNLEAVIPEAVPIDITTISDAMREGFAAMSAPVVNVAAPEIHVAPAAVTVNVPETKAPSVTVETPIDNDDRQMDVTYDSKGNINRVITRKVKKEK